MICELYGPPVLWNSGCGASFFKFFKYIFYLFYLDHRVLTSELAYGDAAHSTIHLDTYHYSKYEHTMYHCIGLYGVSGME